MTANNSGALKMGFGVMWTTILVLALSMVVSTAEAKKKKPAMKNPVVSVKKAFVRTAPNFLSKAVMSLKYGDKIKLGKTQKDWHQVTVKGKSGWLHKSSVSAGYYVLRDIGKGEKVAKQAYKDETVTAGKGFSPEYEKMYKNKNPKLDYVAVDKMEKMKITKGSMKKFARNGELRSAIFQTK